MAEKDLDLDGLSRYLHLNLQQVERLANRGKIPARRVGGQWRFNFAEIHQWMAERVGVLEEAELAQVEGAMTPDNSVDENEPILIRAMLSPDTIALPLLAKTKNAAIEQMSQLAATTGMLWDPSKMAEAIRSRESLQSTAMDNGVALLHPRRPMPNILGDAVLSVGISPQGILFGGSRILTDVFFLLCSTDDRSHLRILARISRLISIEGFLNSLRDASDPTAVYELICESEADLS